MLHLPTADDARRLREFLAEAQYSHKQFHQATGEREIALRTGDTAALEDALVEASLLNLLLRWFFLGKAQTREAAAEFVPAEVLRILLDCGLLTGDGALLHPQVMLTPCDDFYFAADLSSRARSPQAADMVLWPNPTTRLLQLFSIQRPSAATLDLGAGCGVMGILAAPHSGFVTATDLNCRAREFTLFNARLNGIENIEYLNGDTFAPVAGRRFDLILANPPFFITPTTGKMFCENDMDLDQYCRRVVREAPGYLNEEGYFQAVLEWVQVRGQSWQERLSEWLEGSGCDAWLLRSYVRDAAGYARERIRTGGLGEHTPPLEAWLDYYNARNVEEIHGGILAMRRRSGPNWTRLDGSPVEANEPFGSLVLDTFQTQDILEAAANDGELLPTRPRLASDALLTQNYRAADGKWNPVSVEIRLTGPAPADTVLDREVAAFLARCDGSRTLDELAYELNARIPVGIEAARAQSCKIVRTLAARRIVHLSRA